LTAETTENKDDLFIKLITKVSVTDLARLKDIFDFGPTAGEDALVTAFRLIKTDQKDLHYISTWHRCFPKATVDKEIMK